VTEYSRGVFAKYFVVHMDLVLVIVQNFELFMYVSALTAKMLHRMFAMPMS
jgi:lipid-A-disaccharide synthase-like uncharacterized protein